ncbi:MAG: helix-turn-helix transcriptional regulator [Bacteroidota bacterium]
MQEVQMVEIDWEMLRDKVALNREYLRNQSSFAKKLGVSTMTLYRFMNGSKLSTSNFFQLVSILGLEEQPVSSFVA